MLFIRKISALCAAAVIPVAIYFSSSFMHADQDWKQFAEGNNLALGKEMILSPTPLFRMTTDGTETTKLTDGHWQDIVLPHSKHAVGWSYIHGNVNMILDLGEEQDIGHIIARFQGGGLWPSIVLPRKIAISLSNDGKTYYEAESRVKVTGGERELAEQSPRTHFYIPEEGVNFVHSFVFPIERKARFVAITVTPGVNNVFSDEIFVMESTAPEKIRDLQGLAKSSIISKGVQAAPKTGDLYISTNVVTPNYFYISDMRSDDQKDEKVSFYLELPEGIEIRTGWKGTAERITDQGEGNRWVIHDLWNSRSPDWQGMEGPVYFIIEEGVTIPEGAQIRISSDQKDSQDNIVSATIHTFEIPEVQPLKDLHVSLTWMSEKDHSYLYPDFFNAFKHFGFTGVGVFPRNNRAQKAQAELKKFADETRAHGLHVVYNESPIHVMAGVAARDPEIYHQIEGQEPEFRNAHNICQTYTGKHYQQELQRVAQHAQLVNPDIVFHDIELWYRSTADAKKCTRCREAFAKSGMQSWDEFMYSHGTRLIRDLHAATAGSAPGGKDPLVGSYNLVAATPVYHDYFEFRQLYPDYLQFGMPVLYVRGDAGKVHEGMRRNYLAMGERKLIPWMTAGTYGEFPPHRVEYMLLEAFLNGASGVTYYRFQDHDPLDFYHQAIALNYLAPFEKLLTEGKLIELEQDNDRVAVTLWGNDEEALLLVGNYTPGNGSQQVTIGVTGKSFGEIVDLKTQGRGNGDVRLQVQIDEDQQSLLHVRFK